MAITNAYPKPGQVVLVHRDLSPLDPIDLITAPWSWKFQHCGICVGDNDMIAAVGFKGVSHGPANGQNLIGVDVDWDFAKVQAWLNEQLGKPYDWTAYGLLFIPHLFKKQPVRNDRYICSALVGQALTLFAPQLQFTAYRTTTPDHVAHALGVI